MNLKQRHTQSFKLLAVAVIAGALTPAAGADSTWSGGTAGTATDFATSINWTEGVTPGLSGNASNVDIASFAAAGTGTPIGLNFTTLGTPYYLGQLQILSGSAARTLGSNGSIAGALVLNGSGGTIIDNQSTNLLTINALTSGTGALSLRLGNTSSIINANGAVTLNANIDELSSLSSISKTGTGSLTLGGTNTFTGGITQSAGNLTITSAAALGSGAYFLSNGNTGLATSVSNAAFGINNNSAVTIANAITLPAPSAATSYTIMKGSASKTTGTQLDFAGPIDGGSSNLTLYFNSNFSGDTSTTFRLSGNNTFTGTLRVNRGVLVVNNAKALGAGTNPVILDSNVNTTIGNLSFQVGGAFTNPVTITSAGAYPIGVTGSNIVTLSSPITSSAAFTKVDSGTLITTATNVFGANAVNINGGTFQIGAGGTTGALGSTGTVTISSGATLGVNYGVNGTDAIALNNVISGAGSLVKSGAGVLTLSGATSSYSGGTTLNAGGITIASAASIGTGNVTVAATGTSFNITGTAVTLPSTVNFLLPSSTGRFTFATPSNSASVINGNISGGNPNTVANSTGGTEFFFQGGGSSANSGMLTLNGDNTGWQGTLNIQRGPVVVGSPTALGSTVVRFDSNLPPAGVLQFAGNYTVNNQIYLQAGASSAIGTPAGVSATIGGVISSNGALGINKVGAGMLTLTNNNTYSGATAVSDGILAVNGGAGNANTATVTTSGTGTGAVSVTGTGTLGGTGFIGNNSALTIGTGGRITGGNGTTAGLLTTKSQTWAGAGSYLVNISNASNGLNASPSMTLLSQSAGYSQLGMSSLTVTANGSSPDNTFTIALKGAATDLQPNSGYVWQVGFVTGAAPTATTGLQLDTSGFSTNYLGTYQLTFDSVAGGTAIDVRFASGSTATPEPSTLAFGMTAALPLLLSRRRRNSGRLNKAIS